MKKLSVIIPIAVMFLILAVLFVFMCLPLGQKTILAVDGTLDLRGEDMESYIFPLTGQWKFVYGELLMPERFPEGTGTVTLPPALNDDGYWLDGCATYRLVINTDGMRAPMLYLPEIYSAYVLYVNGGIARSAGVVSPDEGTARPLIENALVPIGTENGIVELVIQVSNYDFYSNSMHIPLLFGESDSMHAFFYRTRALYCMSMGCILMAVFYHLALFIFRRREKIYLIFSMLCMLCYARFLMETNGINQFFGWIPLNGFGIRFYLVLYFLHYASIVHFTMYVFSRGFLARHRYAAAAYTVLSFLFFLFMPVNQSYSPYAFGIAIFPFFLFAVVMAARSPVLRENNWARLYFAALLLYIVIGFVGKAFLENVLFMVTLLTNMFMVMSQSLVLSRSYARAFELVEETNENLERIVCERTQNLQNVNSSMKELIANISHDLKTPVTVMSVNLEELSDPSRKPDGQEYWSKISVAYRESLDLQRLLQNLLDVSRIEAGSSLYAPEPVLLSAFLVSVQEKYGDFMDCKGLFFDIDYNEDSNIIIDPQRIWSVFDNIIYNAARHTEKGGITITAEAQAAAVTLTVTDTGCGIAPHHLPHIFERFYKGSSDRGAKNGDSGLGLYIVRSVMEGIGGGATARSEPGTGTSIILTFRRRE